METSADVTELRQFFQIKIDLANAVRSGSTDDAKFHVEELLAIKQHTTSARLRDACAIALAEFNSTKTNAVNIIQPGRGAAG